jgi:hypothetical protein
LNDLLWIRAIRSHGQGPAPDSFYISRHRQGGRLVGDEADRYIVALCGSKPRSRCAYAATSTRYQNQRCLRDAIHLENLHVVTGC